MLKNLLKYFSSNIDSYSIVLTDFKMEGRDGWDFAKEVRWLSGNSVTMIMITGYFIYNFAMEEEIANLVTRVIMKSFSLKNLYTILCNYLERD